MKQIERNLLISTQMVVEEAQSLIDIVNRYPSESEINLRRRKTIDQKIGMGLAFIKALKMITCDHNKGKGSTTGIAYIQTIGRFKIVESIKEVTKRCDNCNQVFYRKKYNLRKKKKQKQVYGDF